MDPVSHLLLGRLIAAARERGPVVPGVVAATVLGGVAPDVDIALTAFGWDIYLQWHAAGTHALAGTPLVALLTALVVRTWAPTPSFGALALGAWLGALGHVAFDLYSGASIRLLWPVSETVFTMPVVAMADPLAIAAMLLAAATLWIWPRIPRVSAVVALAALVLLAGVKLTTRTRAATAYARAVAAQGDAPVQHTLDAGWGSWRAWHVFDRLPDGTVRAFAVDGWSGEVRERFRRSSREGDAGLRQARKDFSTAQRFIDAHPYAFGTLRQDADGHVVFWSDARFCWSDAEGPDHQEGVPHQDVRAAQSDVRCALWFGGSYDAGGRPWESLVWLGGHLQRRKPRSWWDGLAAR